MSTSLSGRRIGSFDVGPLIGAGGMGEVYRGRDTRLNRDVAIKVLLPAVAGDGERLARFNREAQVLASLNHPNIAHIHGISESASGPLLILEFVDGPTLADRLANGALPVDEAIAISKQIADALEAAHERGIIHRDLKPANIKVDDHGNVKVLDFGLAKAIDPSSGIGHQASGEVANSPTITSPAMTQAGLILGTAAYMSPEQAKGRVVDKRSDVWAFGCVLYDMLTGTRAFGGEDVTDTIAAVVRGEPDWTKLPPSTPSQIRLLLKRCLEKDRKTRISDIGVARFLLNETIETVPASAISTGARRGPLVAFAALVVGALIGAGAWAWSTRPPVTSSAPIRFEIAPTTVPMLAENIRTVAVAPDGSFVVYRGARAGQGGVLMVRSMNELEPRLLSDSAVGRAPFISPDNKWIGFFSPTMLRKVPVGGGPPVDICRFEGAPRGASWGDDGHIVFSASRMPGLQRVSAAGGEPKAVTTPQRAVRDQHSWPHVLPGGRFVAYTVFDAVEGASRVDLLDMTTGTSRALLANAFSASYVDTGHLVFGVATGLKEASLGRYRASLRAVRFDLVKGDLLGEPETIIDSIATDTDASINIDVSRKGDLVYLIGGGSAAVQRTLVWVDRDGRETAIPAPPREYSVARLSPDGTRLALDARDQPSDIMVWDVERQTLTPVNSDPSMDASPVWTPDSRRIIWSSTRTNGVPTLFWQAADGSGTVEQLTEPGRTQFSTSVTPDGKTILLFAPGGGGAAPGALLTHTIGDTDRRGKVLLTTGADPDVSPDGKWLAYHSGESAGERQVFVRPYPNVQDRRFQISSAGGSRPVWARNGRELFFLDGQGMLSSVTVTTTGANFSAGPPKQILKSAYHVGRTALGLDLRSYDVSADGQRFLMIKEPEAAQRALGATRLVVVLNWAQELQTRLP